MTASIGLLCIPQSDLKSLLNDLIEIDKSFKTRTDDCISIIREIDKSITLCAVELSVKDVIKGDLKEKRKKWSDIKKNSENLIGLLDFWFTEHEKSLCADYAFPIDLTKDGSGFAENLIKRFVFTDGAEVRYFNTSGASKKKFHEWLDKLREIADYAESNLEMLKRKRGAPNKSHRQYLYLAVLKAIRERTSIPLTCYRRNEAFAENHRAAGNVLPLVSRCFKLAGDQMTDDAICSMAERIRDNGIATEETPQ